MWRVEFDPEARLLSIRLHEHVTPRDVRDLGRAYTQALACTAGQPFRALLDLRRLFPLEGEAVELLTALKLVGIRDNKSAMEMFAGFDTDGSGDLEFHEFEEIAKRLFVKK